MRRKRCGDLDDLVDDLALAADHAPPVAPAAHALRYGKAEGLERRHGREELVDLEGAGETALDPQFRPQARDVLALQQDLPGGRREHAGEQVDEGGLAGAVRADQAHGGRPARA